MEKTKLTSKLLNSRILVISYMVNIGCMQELFDKGSYALFYVLFDNLWNLAFLVVQMYMISATVVIRYN